jgi:hypothetical protein
MAEKIEKKTSAWLARIGDRQTAWSMTRECGIAMLFWAVVQAAFSFKYGQLLLIHTIILAVGGFCLLRLQSRAAAVVLLLYALAGTGVTLAINSGAKLEGNSNLALALLIFWTAFKGVEATFRLRGRFAFTAPASASAPANAV